MDLACVNALPLIYDNLTYRRLHVSTVIAITWLCERHVFPALNMAPRDAMSSDPRALVWRRASGAFVHPIIERSQEPFDRLHSTERRELVILGNLFPFTVRLLLHVATCGLRLRETK